MAFNVVFVVFFELYSAADEWAVDRTEAHGGFDPTQLLPHSGVMWLCARVALALLIVLDVLLVVRAWKLMHRAESAGRETPALHNQGGTPAAARSLDRSPPKRR